MLLQHVSRSTVPCPLAAVKMEPVKEESGAVKVEPGTVQQEGAGVAVKKEEQPDEDTLCL